VSLVHVARRRQELEPRNPGLGKTRWELRVWPSSELFFTIYVLRMMENKVPEMMKIRLEIDFAEVYETLDQNILHHSIVKTSKCTAKPSLRGCCKFRSSSCPFWKFFVPYCPLLKKPLQTARRPALVALIISDFTHAFALCNTRRLSSLGAPEQRDQCTAMKSSALSKTSPTETMHRRDKSIAKGEL
jgi:hypothetical protein